MRVMIVDDEYLQRELVKHSIDWDKLGLHVCAEAEDGIQALALVKEVWPDIIIMDINIPLGNGLEISRQIKAMRSDIQILILTAYGEFEYARDALHFGAVSFVLKPLDEEELTRELLRAKEAALNIRTELERMLELEHENQQKEKEQFLLELTAGLADQPEFVKRCRRHGIPDNQPYYLMLLRDRSAGEHHREDEHTEIIIERFSDTVVYTVESNRMYILFEPEPGRDEFLIQLNSLCSCLNSGDNFLSGGVSELHRTLGELHLAYQEAYQASARFNNRVVLYEPENMAEVVGLAADCNELFRTQLQRQKYDAAIGTIITTLNSNVVTSYSTQSIMYLTSSVAMAFATYLMEAGIDLSAELGRLQHRIFAYAGQQKTKQQLAETLEFLQKGTYLLQERVMPSSQKKVAEARIFIEEYFDNSSLSLNLVAERIGLNPCYLSNIFKRECGFSLSGYIIKVRLNEAKKAMIKEPYITVAEVAERVAYADVYYFSKSFKKQYGISPSDFMKERML